MTEVQKPRDVAAKVNNMETGKLIVDYAPAEVTPDSLKAGVALLANAKQAKAEFVAENAYVLAQKAEVDKQVRDAERSLYAALAQAAMTMTEEAFAALTKALPDGLGFTPRYEVHGDDGEIFAFCLKYAPHMLMVNRPIFDAHVEALDKLPKYVRRPDVTIPATYVKTTLPTVSDKIGGEIKEEPDAQS